MVIRRTDRVSSILREDESLVEAFVAVSPVFERLRNPAMRKVMARLVTVEQAARVAGVDPDLLVARLNGEVEAAPRQVGNLDGVSEADPSDRDPPAFPGTGAAAADGPFLPSPSAGIPSDPSSTEGTPSGVSLPAIVHLDVREDLRAGREPFSRIMAARQEIPPGGGLCLRAIFEPVPLYGVMERFGFTHHTVQLGEEDWQVWFIPAEPSGDRVRARRGGEVAGGPATETGGRGSVGPHPEKDSASGPGPVVLDVRWLEPPEPMMRTLAALETLPPGGTLIQLNVRVPQFLLPRIEERGFIYEIHEEAPDLVRVVIRHRPLET